MKFRSIFCLFILITNSLFAQVALDDEKKWSATYKLNELDYKIKISSQKNTPIYSQFVIRTVSISGFDLFKKNLNKKVENVFMGNASWIQITKGNNLTELLNYQQIQFDFSEIMARKFRKKILENKKFFLRTPSLINKILNETMTDFSKIRLQIEKDTNSGLDKKEVIKWQDKVTILLEELKDFSYENTSKINLDKE
jgi:hypothetical protein